MNNDHVSSSAALYFDPKWNESVPLLWLERICDLFAQYELEPILFTAIGGGFEPDDCNVLAGQGGDITLWGETLPARRLALTNAMNNRTIESLSLDSPRPGAVDRSDWRGAVSVFLTNGYLHLGLDDTIAPPPCDLLRCAYDIAKEIFAVRYGIAYKMRLSQYPDGYAGGSNICSPMDVLAMIRNRSKWESQKKSRDAYWRNELNGQRRHLTGLFRGAYTASIISESHLESAAVTSLGIGKLSELEKSLWLWELTSSELPIAESALESRGVLIGT